MKRRILYVNDVGRISGAEESLWQLINALDRSRFTPLAAVPASGGLADLLRANNCPVVPIPELRLRRTFSPISLAAFGVQWMRASCAIGQMARDWNVSLIHSNSTTAHVIGTMAATFSRTPALWHVRDMQSIPGLQLLAAHATRGVVYCSGAARKQLPLRDLSGAVRCIVHNGIDVAEFREDAEPGSFRRELGCGAETTLILMVAQMVPWKRHEDLIRATQMLTEEGERTKLILAGEDMFGEHQAYVNKLRRLVDEFDLGDNVIFTGYRRDIASLVSDCDLMVIPSRNEPFGRVALEAMALEKPVVASNDAGLAEVVEDGETGLLVPPEDPRTLSRAIKRLITSPQLARRMGMAGYDRVRCEFDVIQHARKIEQMYETVIQSHYRDKEIGKCLNPT
ncbi:MAG: glycosyltransferase family 4 protein [Planctomycetota bacterium]